MKNRNFGHADWRAIAVALGLWAVTSVHAADPLRLAVIADELALAPTADLLSVALSKNDRVSLVERAQLNKVLSELALSSGHGTNLLKLGEMVAADGLIALDLVRREGKELFSARLIAVKPGVVLAVENSAWPLEKPDEWPQRLLPRLTRLFPKLTVARDRAIPISVLNLRSALRSIANEETERELLLLLVHRLTQERELFVLERVRLAEASFEKELQAGEDSEFWTGRYLLDGVLDRDGFDPQRLTVNARMTAPQGGVTAIEVAGSRSNLLAIVETLASKILAELKRNVASADWRPLLEAEQFYDEAKWLARWELWPEAIAASESAWALGRRSPDVAAMRIRAYCGDMMPIPTYTGTDYSEYPPPQKLRLAIRAAELFAQHEPMLFSDSSRTNAELFDVTFDTFHKAVALLNGFYDLVEMRRGNEGQIAELRAACRRMLPAVEAHYPTNRWKHDLEMVDRMRWREAGAIFEKPEDSLPLFRAMLEHGYYPAELPFLAGWTWEDRKRLPGLMRQFVDDLRTCTNRSARWEGLYLTLLREPFDGAGRFKAREAEVLSALWDDRALVLSEYDTAGLFWRIRDLLKSETKYGDRITNGPFSSFFQKVLKDYLATTPVWNERVFRRLLLCSESAVTAQSWATAQEAGELAPFVSELKSRLKLTGSPARLADSALNDLNRIAGLADPVAAPPRPKSAEFAELYPDLRGESNTLLTVKFVPWQLSRNASKNGMFPRILEVILRGGKLWALVQYHEQYLQLAKPASVYVAVDTATGRCEEIPFPEKLGTPESGLEVTEDSIFASLHNKLQRYRFATKAWEAVAIPMEEGAKVLRIGKWIYLGTKDGLLEFDPDSGRVVVVASSRRRPQESEMDSLWKSDAVFFAWPDAKPGVAIDKSVFSYDRDTRTWTKSSLPDDARHYETKALVSAEGIDMLLIAYPWQRLVGFRNHGQMLHSLLARIPTPAAHEARLDEALGARRWDWPPSVDLDYPCVMSEAEGLWYCQPRYFYEIGPQPIEPIKFSDERTATFFRYEPGRKQALPMAVRFEKDGKPFDPFRTSRPFLPAGWRIGTFYSTPHHFNTPGGLILACWSDAGHWLLPRADLERRLVALRKQLDDGKSEASAK